MGSSTNCPKCGAALRTTEYVGGSVRDIWECGSYQWRSSRAGEQSDACDIAATVKEQNSTIETLRTTITALQQQLADARQALTRIKSLCHTAMKLGHERDSLIVIEAMCNDAEGDRE